MISSMFETVAQLHLLQYECNQRLFVLFNPPELKVFLVNKDTESYQKTSHGNIP